MKRLLFVLVCIVAISIDFPAICQPMNKVDTISIIYDEITELNNSINELQGNISQLEKKVEYKETDIKAYVQTTYTDWITSHATIIFWLVGILGIVGVWMFIRKIVSSVVKKRIKAHLDSDEWFNALQAKINKQLDQNKFKQNMKIGVLAKDENNNLELLNFFAENDFPNIIPYYFTGDDNIDFGILNDDIHILVINNKNNQFELPDRTSKSKTNNANIPITKLINQIKVDPKKLPVFYFNDEGTVFPKELDKGLISSYSNSFAAIYHNLLDLMRYKYKVIDEKD